MINENNFFNNQKPEEAMNNIKTKEGSQQELIERFKLRKTSDFQFSLQKGDIELVENAFNFILDKKNEDENNFPQYNNSWVGDRRREIEFYKKLKADGTLEKLEPRSVEDQRKELQLEFGFSDTSGFRNELKENILEAERFLNYLENNKFRFMLYLPIWDSWFGDRQRELADAKKLQS